MRGEEGGGLGVNEEVSADRRLGEVPGRANLIALLVTCTILSVSLSCPCSRFVSFFLPFLGCTLQLVLRIPFTSVRFA